MGLCEKERGYFGVCSWHDEMNESLDGKCTFPAGMCKVTPDVQDVTGGELLRWVVAMPDFPHLLPANINKVV